MKKIVFILAFALLARPVLAQTVYPGSNPRDGVQASMGTTGDEIRLGVSGAYWATLNFVCVLGGTALFTGEMTTDNGVNWLLSPLARRLSVSSSNPVTQTPAGLSCTTGEIWEVPIPANITHYRLRSGAGTNNLLRLYGGLPYVPGIPVYATIFDLTAAFTVAIDSGTLETAGWTSLTAYLANNDTGGVSRALQVIPRFPDGTTMASGAQSSTVNTGTGASLSLANGSTTTATAYSNLGPRTQVTVGAGTGAGGSARLVVQVRR